MLDLSVLVSAKLKENVFKHACNIARESEAFDFYVQVQDQDQDLAKVIAEPTTI